MNNCLPEVLGETPISSSSLSTEISTLDDHGQVQFSSIALPSFPIVADTNAVDSHESFYNPNADEYSLQFHSQTDDSCPVTHMSSDSTLPPMEISTPESR